MTIDKLKELIADGMFHHATYRNRGTVWEGLWIYVKSSEGFRGFKVAGCFSKDFDSEGLEQAIKLCKGTGISLGSYGNG